MIPGPLMCSRKALMRTAMNVRRCLRLRACTHAARRRSRLSERDRSHTMPWPALAPPAPPATASLFTHDGATLAYALPAAVPRALLLVAHGCRNSGRNWFTSAPAFGSPVRSSLPEESCVTAHAIAAGFAVLAPTASADCWSAADLAPVEALVRAWGASQPGLPSALPLFAYGTSSGGYFAHLAARQWSLAAVSMTVSVPPLAEVQPPQPRGKAYPPLQLLYMQRDTGKAKEVQLLLEAVWQGKPEMEALLCAPRRVTPLYFTERAALSPNHSSAVHAVPLAAGHLKPDGAVASHPQRGAWRAAVQGALPKRERAGCPRTACRRRWTPSSRCPIASSNPSHSKHEPQPR